MSFRPVLVQVEVSGLSDDERAGLQSILPEYYAYLSKRKSSLITRFYGLYSVKVYGVKLTVVVSHSPHGGGGSSVRSACAWLTVRWSVL